MQDAQRQRLPQGQNARVSAGGAGGGGCLIAFSLPFIAVGLFVLWIGFNPDVEKRKNAPDWVFAAIGTIFGGAGGAVAVNGVRTIWVARRRAAARRSHPGEPWVADYRWSREGVWDDPPSLLGQLGLSAFLTVFLAPFNFFAWFTDKDDMWVPRIVVSVFDLVLLLVVAGLAYSFLQRMKYGRSYLGFDAFPFLAGGPLRARLRVPRGLATDKLKVVLRALESVTETTQTGRGTRIQTHLDQVWAEEKHLDQPGLLAGGDVTLVFDLPANAPGTDLDGEAPRYWELTVAAETPGIDYATAFVVPVYAPRGQ